MFFEPEFSFAADFLADFLSNYFSFPFGAAEKRGGIEEIIGPAQQFAHKRVGRGDGETGGGETRAHRAHPRRVGAVVGQKGEFDALAPSGMRMRNAGDCRPSFSGRKRIFFGSFFLCRADGDGDAGVALEQIGQNFFMAFVKRLESSDKENLGVFFAG